MVEAFWKKVIRRKRISLLSIPGLFFWVVSLFYRVGAYYRRAFPGQQVKLPVPVVSIGNITVGGTGKTPLCALIARFLTDEGFKVGIVSSGYGRESTEPLVFDGYHAGEFSPEQVGDEVKHLSMLLPDVYFSVAEKKVEAAQNLLAQTEVDLILIDDGFQHFQLARDLEIVTYDAAVKKRLLKPFPAGLLREPLSALKKADIIVLTRTKFARDINKLMKKMNRINRKADIYRAQFNATHVIGKEQSLPVKYLEDKHVLLFAGIGNFKSLKKQVFAMCADLDEALELSDHQVYTKEKLSEIKALADDHDSDLILTTGKDWVKTESFDFDREFYYLNQTIDLDPGEEKLVRLIIERLALKKTER